MRTERPRRVFGYARVSGAEQGRTGTSLDGQRAEILRWCSAHSYPEPQIRIEVESGSAEKIERRHELRSLLAELHEGDLVLVCKVDRWSRDIVHGVQSVRALVARGVDWVSIGEGIDASTANGDSMLGIMAWAADNERKRIKERTVGRRKILRDEGQYIEGLVPVGYERGPKNVLRPVESDAAIVRAVFARCVEGSSVQAIADRLRKQHPDRHGWDKKTIAKILHGRVYLGEVRTSSGAWVAAHEPIIDRITWERARRALESRRLAGPRPLEESRTHLWLLRGLASCAWCGAHMSAAYGPLGRTGDRWGYYMCRGKCGARLVPVAACDRAVEEAAIAHLVALRDELAKETAGAPAAAPDLEDRRAQLQRKRERTIDLATDGTIDRGELQRRLVSIDRAIAKIDIDADEVARSHKAALPEVRSRVLRDVQRYARSWNRLPVPDRRGIVEIIASKIAIAREEVPRIEWRSIADLVAD